MVVGERDGSLAEVVGRKGGVRREGQCLRLGREEGREGEGEGEEGLSYLR